MNIKLRWLTVLLYAIMLISAQCMAVARIPVSIQSIPNFNNENPPSWLFDNIGGLGADPNAWIPALPLNTNVVFELSQPLSHLLFQWAASFNYNYNEMRYGAPSSYTIETSSNSTNGSDGDWMTEVNVIGNPWAARAHEIKSTEGIRWIRLRITAGGSSITEVDIHDLSQCQPGVACDTWGFIGDSITADTFWRRPTATPTAKQARSFNELVNECAPARFPSMINFGIGNQNSGHILARLQQTIADNPGVYYWAIGIGTNDGDVTQYEQNVTAILNMLIANSKQPIVARIPYSNSANVPDSRIQDLNRVVDRLIAQYKLPAGPDLYSHFKAHPNQLRDSMHPTYEGRANPTDDVAAVNGIAAIQRLWAKVACDLDGGNERGSASAVVAGPLAAQTILGNLTPDTASRGKAGKAFVLLNLAPFTDPNGFAITTGYTLWAYDGMALSLILPQTTLAQICATVPAYYSGFLQALPNMALVPVAADLTLFAGSGVYIGYGKDGFSMTPGAACLDMMTSGTLWHVYTMR